MGCKGKKKKLGPVIIQCQSCWTVRVKSRSDERGFRIEDNTNRVAYFKR